MIAKEKFYIVGIEESSSACADSARHILLTSLAFDEESDALKCAASLQKSRGFFKDRKFVVCIFDHNTQPL